MKAFITQLNRWQIDAFGYGLCGLVTAVAVFAAILPFFSSRVSELKLQDTVASLEVQMASMASTRQNLENQLEQTQEQLESSKLTLEPLAQLNRRIARVVDLAAQAGLTIEETSSGKPITGELFNAIPIRLAGVGTYPQGASFLHQLTTQCPDISVIGFEMSGDPGLPKRPATLSFTLHWLAAPTVASAQ